MPLLFRNFSVQRWRRKEVEVLFFFYPDGKHKKEKVGVGRGGGEGVRKFFRREREHRTTDNGDGD